MILPDCREDNDYNEKFLNENDKTRIAGYDWCAEEVVDNFFDIIEDLFDDDSHLMHMLNEKLPESMQGEEIIEHTFSKRIETRKIETYKDLLRSKLGEHIEDERNEIIVSMIDNMDKEKYESIKSKALKK